MNFCPLALLAVACRPLLARLHFSLSLVVRSGGWFVNRFLVYLVSAASEVEDGIGDQGHGGVGILAFCEKLLMESRQLVDGLR